MLNYVWGFIIIISVICAIVTGRISELSQGIFEGASSSIELVMSLCGMMCLFTGLMKIAEKGGLTLILSKLFRPIIKYLFPDYKEDSPAIAAVCMNITANLLGLGNAATPLGIAAIKEMAKLNTHPHTANNSMVMFVVLNTASIQLIPSTMAIIRQSHGSPSPFDVTPATWITSLFALLMGISAAKLLERRSRYLG